MKVEGVHGAVMDVTMGDGAMGGARVNDSPLGGGGASGWLKEHVFQDEPLDDISPRVGRRAHVS